MEHITRSVRGLSGGQHCPVRLTGDAGRLPRVTWEVTLGFQFTDSFTLPPRRRTRGMATDTLSPSGSSWLG